MTADAFRFAPELIEYQAEARMLLADAGIEWFSDYASLDTIHDLYGLEVSGIREEEVAQQILTLLRGTFPEWSHARLFLDESSRAEQGWRVQLHRDRPVV